MLKNQTLIQNSTCLNNKKTSITAWISILSSSLFFFYAFINMTCFNAINKSLMSSLHVSSLEISQLSAMYFYANIIFLIPAGLILDKYSIRKIFLIIMPISIASTFIFSLTHSYQIACIMRFIMGITSTFCLLGSVKLTSNWLEDKYAARAISIIVTIAMLGGVLAQQIPSIIPKQYNWQDLLKIISLIGVICYFIIYILLKDAPIYKSSNNKSKKHAWIFALKNKQNYLLGFLTNFLSTPIMILGALWGSSYLIETKHLSANSAQNCCSLLFIGLIIGSPVFGWISDIFKSRKKPIIYGIIGALITVILIIEDNSYQTRILMPLLFFSLGFFTSCQVISYAIIIEVNPPEQCAFSESIASTIIMSSGAIFQPLFGYILSLNMNINRNNYQQAMIIFPAVFSLCLIICFFIKIKKTKNFKIIQEA